MKKNVKNKVIITITFLSIAATTVFVSDYVASYYEKLGRSIPRWLSYTILSTLIVVLILAYTKFVEVFSGGKKR